MDVVANACPIGRLVVGAENRDGISIAACSVQNERNQVRFRIVVFTDLAIWICSGRIEIAQSYGPQLVSRMKIGEMRSTMSFVSP